MNKFKHFYMPMIFIAAYISFIEPAFADPTREEQARISQAIHSLLNDDSSVGDTATWLKTQKITSYRNQVDLVGLIGLVLPEGNLIDVETFLRLGLKSTSLLSRLDRDLRFSEVSLQLMELYEQLQYFRIILSAGDAKISSENAERIKPVLRQVSGNIRRSIEWYLSDLSNLRVSSNAERINDEQRNLVKKRLVSLEKNWNLHLEKTPGQTPVVAFESEQTQNLADSWTLVPTSVDDAEVENDDFILLTPEITSQQQRMFRVSLSRPEVKVSARIQRILDDRNLTAKMRYLILEVVMLDPQNVRDYKFSEEKVLSHLEGLRADLTMRGDSHRYALVVTEVMNLWIKYKRLEREKRQSLGLPHIELKEAAILKNMIVRMSELSQSEKNHQLLPSGVKKSVELRNPEAFKKSYNNANGRAALQLQNILSSSEVMQNDEVLVAVLSLAQILPVRRVRGENGVFAQLRTIPAQTQSQEVFEACKDLDLALGRRYGIAPSRFVMDAMPEDIDSDETLIDSGEDTDIEETQVAQIVSDAANNGKPDNRAPISNQNISYAIAKLADSTTSPAQTIHLVSSLISLMDESAELSSNDYRDIFGAFTTLPYSKVLSPLVADAVRKYMPKYLQNHFSDQLKLDLLATLSKFLTKFPVSQAPVEHVAIRQTLGVIAVMTGAEIPDVHALFGECEGAFF